MKQVTIYTDGACSGNPGPGGYGVVLLYGTHRKELSAGFEQTTNNRMELLAAIVGLEALRERCAVTIYSDSKYVVDAIRKGWAVRWRSRGWKRAGNQPAINADLWRRMLKLLDAHEVRLEWVKGHAGDIENERCDVLATTALRSSPLRVDDGYSKRVPCPT